MNLLRSTVHGLLPQPTTCRFVVRREESLGEVYQFVVGGLEVGQQVVALAGPTCLKDLASALGESGLRPEALLRSGRLVFITAPDSLPALFKSGDLFRRGQLRLNGSLLRWVSDWSWACGCDDKIDTLLDYERRVHQLVNRWAGVSLCSASCEKIGRSPLLAMMAEHRRSSRAPHAPPRSGMSLPSNS